VSLVERRATGEEWGHENAVRSRSWRMKGRTTVAFTWSSEQALFDRRENILLSDRERGEGFPELVVAVMVAPSEHGESVLL